MKLFYTNSIDGITVKKYLYSIGYSLEIVKSLTKSMGLILVNNIPSKTTKTIYIGDQICVNIVDEISSKIQPINFDIQVLYEDEYYLAVNKPCNMPTITSKLHQTDTLSNFIMHYMLSKQNNFVIRAVNRLDSATSGIVIFSKNALAQHLLTTYRLETRKIEKTYLALLDGNVDDTIVEYGIEKDESFKARYKLSITGKYAKTKFEKIKNVIIDKKVATLSKITLFTGRTHQIRLHSTHISSFILGDNIYQTNCNNSGLKNSTCPPTAIALHAYSVEFIHPFTKQKIFLQANPKINEYFKDINI